VTVSGRFFQQPSFLVCRSRFRCASSRPGGCSNFLRQGTLLIALRRSPHPSPSSLHRKAAIEPSLANIRSRWADVVHAAPC
jgi:hypothetical protein